MEEQRIDLKNTALDVYRAMAAFDRSIELDPALRELVKIRASQLNGCAYCIALHTRDARKAGESEQRLYALAAWRESPLFSERERVALELTDTITRIGESGVPEAVYERAASEFSPAELANLIFAITAINAWNRIAVTSGLVFADTP
ncbi:MAG TPA: carboxymuconolactone decarboxylase family protein [Solirubrobacteraceae bacterium]